jgi:trk system potassium uptake protein TrkA
MPTQRFVVVGLGNFGASVAEALHAAGHDVLAVDTEEETVDRIAPLVTRAVVADGRDVKALERIGAKEADAAIVSTGDDITASILSAMALRDLAVANLYVKVVSVEHARVMEKLGVTDTVFPERDSGQRLATRIASRAILNYVRLGAGFGVQEMAVPESWIGRTLRELQLPKRFRVSVIALHDVLTDQMIPVPDPDAPLKDSDALLLSGAEADLARAAKLD